MSEQEIEEAQEEVTKLEQEKAALLSHEGALCHEQRLKLREMETLYTQKMVDANWRIANAQERLKAARQHFEQSRTPAPLQQYQKFASEMRNVEAHSSFIDEDPKGIAQIVFDVLNASSGKFRSTEDLVFRECAVLHHDDMCAGHWTFQEDIDALYEVTELPDVHWHPPLVRLIARRAKQYDSIVFQLVSMTS